MKVCYHTTPIYYVNDVPHVGHAYTTIAADALTRARRLLGHDVRFVTGTDEHGQNIERIARARGVSEQQHCDEIAAVFAALWERLEIRYDRFIRTTEPAHERGVLELWGRLTRARCPDGRPAVYRGTYAGWYCPRCEGFKEEADLKQPDNLCPDHERPCEWTEEENFFFRLSAYEGWLREQIESGRLRIEPEGRRNEILALARQGLKDFSVSRARVRWGIPVPEQPDHVLYVWVDALANYVTALGFGEGSPDFERYWGEGAERMHLLGKDIIRFHCLYWPAILHAAGIPPPSREFAQGFITKNGKRLSKTTGNVIDPGALVELWGSDAVRYFLLREGVYGQDWDFTEGALLNRYNADLANDLGNLVSRALTMVNRYCGGKVPPKPAGEPVGGAHEVALQSRSAEKLKAVLDRYEALDFSGALAEIWSSVGELNSAIVVASPWELAKDPVRRHELEPFLYRLIEAVRLVGVLISPVMPRAARRVAGMLGLGERDPVPADLEWGLLEPGRPLGELKPLFPRAEKAEAAPPPRTPAPTAEETKETTVSEEKPAGAPAPPPPLAPAPQAERIDIAEFARIELRVAQVLAAEKVAGSKKLIKMQIDLGGEQRQIVAGIAESYAPESLPGRKVAVVANLKPAKLMGVESNGMVLAASLEGKAVLLSLDAEVPPGTRIK